MITDLLKLKFTIFALPFALAGGLLPLAMGYSFPSWETWVWGLIGFTAARTAGMAFNQLIDRKIDAQNPRTNQRVLPSGRAQPILVSGIAWTALALFLVCCEQISPLLFAISPYPAILIVLYSYTKRFTALCHFVLGSIYLFIPTMAWIAVTGTFSYLPLFLGVAQTALITSSDIIYALQDVQFDRTHGIYSIPAKLGERGALIVARGLHLIVVASLICLGTFLHPVYYVGVAAIALFLLRRPTFFLTNAVVSLLVLASILGAVLWPA